MAQTFDYGEVAKSEILAVSRPQDHQYKLIDSQEGEMDRAFMDDYLDTDLLTLKPKLQLDHKYKTLDTDITKKRSATSSIEKSMQKMAPKMSNRVEQMLVMENLNGQIKSSTSQFLALLRNMDYASQKRKHEEMEN